MTLMKFPCHKHKDPFINPTWIGLDKTMEGFCQGQAKPPLGGAFPTLSKTFIHIIDFYSYLNFICMVAKCYYIMTDHSIKY